MPAKKAGRQSIKRHRRNGSVRAVTRSALNKALRSVEGGDAADAEATVGAATKILDRAVRKGVLHKNTAAHQKSRISTKLNRLQGA